MRKFQGASPRFFVNMRAEKLNSSCKYKLVGHF